MFRCVICDALVLFGGEQEGELRFCSAKCREAANYLSLADQVPAEVMEKYLREVHEGLCPVCGGEGPVDVHTSYYVWSILVLTTWGKSPRVSCRRCGFKAKLGALIGSGLVGWWGIPFGLFITPVQLTRNLVGLVKNPDPDIPSEALRFVVKASIAKDLAEQIEMNEREVAE